MREDEHCDCECSPEPADFDEVDVEDIAFLGEVAGCVTGVVGLRLGEVGRNASRGVDDAEEGAEEQCRWVDGQEHGFEEGG